MSQLNGIWKTRDARYYSRTQSVAVRTIDGVNKISCEIVSFPRMWGYYGTFQVDGSKIKITYTQNVCGGGNIGDMEEIIIESEFSINDGILIFENNIFPKHHRQQEVDNDVLARTYYLDSDTLPNTRAAIRYMFPERAAEFD